MPYLPEAVSSVLAQDYPNIEIWIADDDSTDGSYEYALKQAAADDRLKVIKLKPKSPEERRTAVALNKGLEQAKGEYIAMMDADDWCDKHKISKQVAYMEQHPQIIACGTQARVKWEGRLWRKNTIVRLPLVTPELKVYLLRQSPFLQNAVMIRKDCIDKHQLRYNETMDYAEDYEFFSRLIKLGELANLDEYLVTYRMHHGQSIRHPDFSNYVKLTVKKNIRDAFSVSDEEAEQHWQFVNHRNGYKVGDLKHVFNWKNQLLALNGKHGKFDPALFQKFVDVTWERRIRYNTRYSLRLLFEMLRQPYTQYWKGIKLHYQAVFVLKCFMGKKQ
jgi:glycosyltransferase involved in cell wall biosynthesis